MGNYAAVAHYAAQKALDEGDREAVEILIAIGRRVADFHDDELSVAKFDELLED